MLWTVCTGTTSWVESHSNENVASEFCELSRITKTLFQHLKLQLPSFTWALVVYYSIVSCRFWLQQAADVCEKAWKTHLYTSAHLQTTSWWTRGSSWQVIGQIFPSGVGKDQNWATRRVNIGLAFQHDSKWMLMLPRVCWWCKISSCWLTSPANQLKSCQCVSVACFRCPQSGQKVCFY